MPTPLKVAVCEDNEQDLSRLLSCMTASAIPAEYETFSSGEALLAAHQAGRYDLIFLDIYMNGLLGIDAAAKIRETDTTVTLIFTTTSTEHALASYRLNAPKYIEKPVMPEEVAEVLSMAQEKRKTAAYIRLLTGGEYRDIPVDSVLYFEQQNRAAIVKTLSGVIRTSQTVKFQHIEPLLPKYFLRCHQSYIVNLKHVKSLNWEQKIFTMHNGDRVYIRHQNMKQAAEAYEDYLLLKLKEKGGRI